MEKEPYTEFVNGVQQAITGTDGTLYIVGGRLDTETDLLVITSDGSATRRTLPLSDVTVAFSPSGDPRLIHFDRSKKRLFARCLPE